MKYQLKKLCAVAAIFMFLALIPRASFAAVTVHIWLDIITNYPGITYAAARAGAQSILSDGSRWGIVGWRATTNLSGSAFCNYPGGQAYCNEGTYVIDLTTRTNYYVPVQPVVNFTTDTNFYYYYIPFSNTLSITASGPVTPVEWTLSGPVAFANSSAYRTSGSGSANLVAVPTGTYSVAALSGVRGYATPTTTSTNITGASPLVNTFALNYIPYSNSLAVIVSGITSASNLIWTLAGPADFTNAVSYGMTFTNTFTVSGIPTGLYTVTFPAVVGYTAPATASTNITGASPLINSMTGSYASVIWPSSTNPPMPAPTNFPAFTNPVSVQAFSNGILAAPLQFWSANKTAITAALGTITNEADFIAWLATNTFDVRVSNLEEATDALNTRVGVLEGN